MTENESQSWGELADEQSAGEEAAAGRRCRSCAGAVGYIGHQNGERWYRCGSCELEQTEGELRAGLTDAEALDRLNYMLSAEEWSVSFLEDACEIVRATGRVEIEGAEWAAH